jgi:photosystem II stability/assembly factor-like uncharacterized protein
MVYYMGAVGGGVWKTTDAGTTWAPISDDTFGTSSVGAIAVAPSDPNVVYVGMGEHAIRGVMTSHGDGVYRSDDGGDTWTHLGLPRSRHISRIRVHPRDADLVYVAVQGAAHGATAERGVYRSRDGGETWEQVLFVSESAGASDLAMDPSNPRILYAAFWDHIRLPWQVVSGGEGSGLWKSTDGGDSWRPMNNGLPELMGKTAVDVSAADPSRLYAMIEADPGGGLYVSENGGRSWELGTDDWALRARPWYYTEVYADPTDENTVYVLSAPMMRSVDGGRTFERVRTPHGDQHDLWINPEDGDVMINANDGGANVSFNGGETWSTQTNQPTVQFYRVNTDNRFPYHVYGGQQDNTTVAIASAAPGGIGFADWYPVGGCESAQPAFDRDDPRFVYAGCYMGILSEYDHRTNASRNAQPYPVIPIALASDQMKYRYNWSAPMVVSQHDPRTIYHGANVLLRSRDGGKSWEQASPDLTRADPSKLGFGGGPITNEGAGGEIYATLAYVAESPLQEGLIWTGSDDGLVHLTRDGGESWEDVTPRGLPEGLVNAIDPSPHDPARACMAFTRYKFNDFTPWAFCTDDFGRSWREVSDGFADEHFVRVVREDPVRPGLLYAGTEQGVYISFDGGDDWQPLGLNLPRTPITDLQIQRDRNDLVAATGGMGFWVLDDLSALQQLDPESDAPVTLYTNRAAYRVAGGGWFGGGNGTGRNPPAEGIVDFHLAREPAGEVRLEIFAGPGHPNAGELVRVATSDPDPDAEVEEVRMVVGSGMHRAPWDLRYPDIVEIPDLYVWGSHNGRRVPPGEYTVRLTAEMDEGADPVVLETTKTVRPDPRLDTPVAEYMAQDRLLREIANEVTAMHRGVMELGGVREQVSALVDRIREMEELEAGETLAEMGAALADSLTVVEDSLVQWETYDGQTVLNAPSRLNLQYIYLHEAVDGADDGVGDASRSVFTDLNARWRPLQSRLELLLTESLDRFNRAVEDAGIPPVDPPARRRPVT